MGKIFRIKSSNKQRSSQTTTGARRGWSYTSRGYCSVTVQYSSTVHCTCTYVYDTIVTDRASSLWSYSTVNDRYTNHDSWYCIYTYCTVQYCKYINVQCKSFSAQSVRYCSSFTKQRSRGTYTVYCTVQCVLTSAVHSAHTHKHNLVAVTVETKFSW